MLNARHAHVCPLCRRGHACRDWQERGWGLFSGHAAITCEECAERRTTARSGAVADPGGPQVPTLTD